jgi:hypothetical protein
MDTIASKADPHAGARRHPLDRPEIDDLWGKAAAALGFRLARTRDAYATTDGRGTIAIGERDTLDDDDALAQLILHEICHALVQGETQWRTADWGLDNASDRDDVAEEACLRLQAHLADPHGLRALMTPTTPWRAYYAALGADPLRETSAADSAACALAVTASRLAAEARISEPLTAALASTAAVVRAAGDWSAGPAHPLGFALRPGSETCGSCAWRYEGGRGKAVARCRQTAPEAGDGRRVLGAWPACVRWERALDCQDCGACCREAYHVVSVSMRDPAVWKQPDMIVRNGSRFSLLRSGDRCAALEVTRAVAESAHSGSRYACRIYDDRPRTCHEFTRGGRHCLTARRRVGLSS